MIPPFDQATGYLPPGIYSATWNEIVERFGWNQRRQFLLAGLRSALVDLSAAGGVRFYLDGSFVTAKDEPGDYDVCYHTDEVNALQHQSRFPVLFQSGYAGRNARRLRYGGDILPYDPFAIWGYLDYFQTDRQGIRKGIILLVWE